MCSQSCMSNFYWGRERILQPQTRCDFSKLWGRCTVSRYTTLQRVCLVSELENWHGKWRDAMRGAGLFFFPKVRKKQAVQVVWSRKKRNKTWVLLRCSSISPSWLRPFPTLALLSLAVALYMAPQPISDTSRYLGFRILFRRLRDTGKLSDCILEQFTHGDQMAICERRANACLPLISGLLSTISKIGDQSLSVTSS